MFLQCSLVAELIEEVEIVGSFEYLNETDDMGTVNFGQDLDFIEGAFFELGVFFILLDVDDFDGHLFLSSGIDASVHFPVLSLPYLFVKGVVLDDLDHSVIFIYLNFHLYLDRLKD